MRQTPAELTDIPHRCFSKGRSVKLELQHRWVFDTIFSRSLPDFPFLNGPGPGGEAHADFEYFPIVVGIAACVGF